MSEERAERLSRIQKYNDACLPAKILFFNRINGFIVLFGILYLDIAVRNGSIFPPLFHRTCFGELYTGIHFRGIYWHIFKLGGHIAMKSNRCYEPARNRMSELNNS